MLSCLALQMQPSKRSLLHSSSSTVLERKLLPMRSFKADKVGSDKIERTPYKNTLKGKKLSKFPLSYSRLDQKSSVNPRGSLPCAAAALRGGVSGCLVVQEEEEGGGGGNQTNFLSIVPLITTGPEGFWCCINKVINAAVVMSPGASWAGGAAPACDRGAELDALGGPFQAIL